MRGKSNVITKGINRNVEKVWGARYTLGARYLSKNTVLPFRGRCGFRQHMPKKPSQYGIKIWMMCDCATKYMMNEKVYLGKENNEVAHGLASDVICTLV